MADIINPNAVKWSNENVRTAANALAQLYYRARRVQDEQHYYESDGNRYGHGSQQPRLTQYDFESGSQSWQ